MKKKINRYIVSIIALFFRFTAWFEFKILRQAKFQSLDQRQEYVFSSVEWEGGREHYVCFPYDQAISKHVYVDGHFGWTHVPRVLKILGSDFKLKTLIDIGANIGTISIPIVKRGLAERAIAFEPEPRNFRTLMANIYINGLADKIVAYNLALGSEEKDVIFELSTDNSGDHRVTVSEQDGMYSESRRKKITVKSKSLDEMFPVSKNNECLIWMDTQGYEGKILEGAKEICKARIPMVIEFWPYGLIRSDSYESLKCGMLCYKYYYDLAEVNPNKMEVTENAIDILFDKFKHNDGWMDLLLL